MSPKIPEPKDPPRAHVVSLRFSDSEKETLDRACVLYAEHWKRKRIGHAELIRAAVEMIAAELESVAAKKKT